MEYWNKDFELIVGLGLLYAIIRLLTMLYIKNNGHSISLFSTRINDLNLIIKVSKKYNSKFVKILHFIHYLFIIVFPIVLVVIFFTSGPSSNFNRCEIVEHFKEREYKGIVVDKYIDTEQHATETVILQNGKSILKIYDFSYLNKNNYNQIQNNDSLSKKSGKKFITLKKDSLYIKFHLNINYNYKKYRKKFNKYNQDSIKQKTTRR